MRKDSRIEKDQESRENKNGRKGYPGEEDDLTAIDSMVSLPVGVGMSR